MFIKVVYDGAIINKIYFYSQFYIVCVCAREREKG